MAIHLGLFYAARFGNNVHRTFIFTFVYIKKPKFEGVQLDKKRKIELSVVGRK